MGIFGTISWNLKTCFADFETFLTETSIFIFGFQTKFQDFFLDKLNRFRVIGIQIFGVWCIFGKGFSVLCFITIKIELGINVQNVNTDAGLKLKCVTLGKC